MDKPTQARDKSKMLTLLSCIVGPCIYILSFFIIEQFEGNKGEVDYIFAAAITGIVTGIMTGKCLRGALVALLSVVVGSVILTMLLGYRIYEGPSQGALTEQSLSITLQDVLLIAGIEAAGFGAIAGGIIEVIKHENASKSE